MFPLIPAIGGAIAGGTAAGAAASAAGGATIGSLLKAGAAKIGPALIGGFTSGLGSGVARRTESLVSGAMPEYTAPTGLLQERQIGASAQEQANAFSQQNSSQGQQRAFLWNLEMERIAAQDRQMRNQRTHELIMQERRHSHEAQISEGQRYPWYINPDRNEVLPKPQYSGSTIGIGGP